MNAEASANAAVEQLAAAAAAAGVAAREAAAAEAAAVRAHKQADRSLSWTLTSQSEERTALETQVWVTCVEVELRKNGKCVFIYGWLSA